MASLAGVEAAYMERGEGRGAGAGGETLIFYFSLHPRVLLALYLYFLPFFYT
jgi:hypothetical protein